MNQNGSILISILILSSIISIQLSGLMYLINYTNQSVKHYQYYLSAYYPSRTGLEFAISKCKELPYFNNSSNEKKWIYDNLSLFLNLDLSETQLYFYKTIDSVFSIAVVNNTYRHIESMTYDCSEN